MRGCGVTIAVGLFGCDAGGGTCRRILAATGDKAARYTAVTASCPEYYVDLRDAHFAIGEASRVN